MARSRSIEFPVRITAVHSATWRSKKLWRENASEIGTGVDDREMEIRDAFANVTTATFESREGQGSSLRRLDLTPFRITGLVPEEWDTGNSNPHWTWQPKLFHHFESGEVSLKMITGRPLGDLLLRTGQVESSSLWKGSLA